MNKTLLIMLFITISFKQLHAQSVYLDPTVVATLRTNGGMLERAQNKTNDEVVKLNENQTLVQGLLIGINNTQNKVHRGLREVNGVVTSGLHLQRTYRYISNMMDYSREAVELAGRNPHHLLLANEQLRRIQRWSTELYADIASIITVSPNNLMTSGERNELLYKIERDAYQLYISSITLVQQLRRINRVGFLNTMNPFHRRYNNRDVEIFTEMLQRNGI